MYIYKTVLQTAFFPTYSTSAVIYQEKLLTVRRFNCRAMAVLPLMESHIEAAATEDGLPISIRTVSTVKVISYLLNFRVLNCLRNMLF